MKKLILSALLVCAPVALFAQGDPKAAYLEITKIQQDEYAAARQTGKQPDSESILKKMKAKAWALVKDVDVSKIEAKDAYDWARIYSVAEKHKETCDLLHKYLTSKPTAAEKFTAQMLMMNSCNMLGEGDMLAHTLADIKPVTFMDSGNLAFTTVYNYTGTIEKTEGLDGALKSIDGLMDRMRFDTKKYATDQLAAAKAREAKNPPEVEPPSDEARLKELEEFGVSTQYYFQLILTNKKAEILADHDKQAEGLKVLDEFAAKIPEFSKQNISTAKVMRNKIALPGTAAPALVKERSYGDFPGLDALKGKVVVLDFFAHWCGPCIAGFPDMRKMYADLKGKGLEVFGVTTYYGYYGSENAEKRDMPKDDEYKRMGDFIKEQNVTWPVVYGTHDNFAAFGTMGIPHVVVIDKKGVVHKIHVGYSPESFDILRKQVEKLLNE